MNVNAKSPQGEKNKQMCGCLNGCVGNNMLGTAVCQ